MPLPPEAAQALIDSIPFHKHIGLEIRMNGAGRSLGELPFRPELIGDAARPAIHGGVLSSMADALGGFAVWSDLTTEDRVSTIDLRVDYLAPAGGETIYGEAEVVRSGNRVAVADIRLWQGARRMVATGKGVYNIRRKGE
jgi:uncharacterized protein (TIGR00369 family)